MTTHHTEAASLPSHEARENLADLLDGTQWRNETYTITRRGKVAGRLVPPNTPNGDLDLARVDQALRKVIAHLDYDLHKNIESDEETGEDTYDEVTAAFLSAYRNELDDEGEGQS